MQGSPTSPGEKPQRLLQIRIQEHKGELKRPIQRSGRPSLFAQAIAEQGLKQAPTRPFKLTQVIARPSYEREAEPMDLKTHPRRTSGFSLDGRVSTDDIPCYDSLDVGILCRSTNTWQREYGLRMLQNIFLVQRFSADRNTSRALAAFLTLGAEPEPESAGHLALLNLRYGLDEVHLPLINESLALLVVLLVGDEGYLTEDLHLATALGGTVSDSVSFPQTSFHSTLLDLGLLPLLKEALRVGELATEPVSEDIINNVLLLVERFIIGMNEPIRDGPLAYFVDFLVEHLLKESTRLQETGEFFSTRSRVALRVLTHEYVLLGCSISRASINVLCAGYKDLFARFDAQDSSVQTELLGISISSYLLLSRILSSQEDLLLELRAIRQATRVFVEGHILCHPSSQDRMIALGNLVGAKLGFSEACLTMPFEECLKMEAPFFTCTLLQLRYGSGELSPSDFGELIHSWVRRPCILSQWSQEALHVHRQAGLLICSITESGIALQRSLLALGAILGEAIPLLSELAYHTIQLINDSTFLNEYRFVFLSSLARHLPTRQAIETGLYPVSVLQHKLATLLQCTDVASTTMTYANVLCATPSSTVIHVVCTIGKDLACRQEWRETVVQLVCVLLGEIEELAAQEECLTRCCIALATALVDVHQLDKETTSSLLQLIPETAARCRRLGLRTNLKVEYPSINGSQTILPRALATLTMALIEGRTPLSCAADVLCFLLNPHISPDMTLRIQAWESLKSLALPLPAHSANAPIEDDDSVLLAVLGYQRSHPTCAIAKATLHHALDGSSVTGALRDVILASLK
ncbi:hypothetical protein GMRT_14638 [Giardia muris]|uniref:Uncharacterized protein n=1 Tax=Giardia muris TaxID=5742 RepID=A0A4Z1SMT0_GIAMU|nr:hypothetical protein GMRT_14638 [Giardia muris]|eukprot:TNJ27022.1 hypothetical protein GMRT_14638 [Giardia muris]